MQEKKKKHKNRVKAKKQSTVYNIAIKKCYIAQYKRKYTKIEHKLKNKAQYTILLKQLT